MFHRRPRRLIAALDRFARAERGATAVEFGLICAPLMLMLFGVLELAMVFLVSTTLETATENAARQIRTGQFQQSGVSTPAAFRTMVCNGMSWLSSTCASDLYVQTQTFATFGDLAAAPPKPPPAPSPGPMGATQPMPLPGCWAPGQPGDIVLVHTYWRWKLFTPGLDLALDNAGGGMRMISTATAFRNEPYDQIPPLGTQCP